MGKIITPGENHHSDRCTEAIAMAIVTSESTNASRRFLVMNWCVSWLRSLDSSRLASRHPAPPGPGRGARDPFGPVAAGCGAVTMMRAL
jgi:hypothetical protein